MLLRLFILGLTVVCAQGAHAITQAEELAACAKHVWVTLVYKDTSCIVPQVHLNFCKTIQSLNLIEGNLQQGFADIVKESLKDPTINGWRVSIQGMKIWGEESDERKLDVCLVLMELHHLPTFKMPDVGVLLVQGNVKRMPFLGTLSMFPNLNKFVANNSGLCLPLMRPNVRTVWNLSEKSDILFLFQAPQAEAPPHPTLFSCADPYVCTPAVPGEAKLYVSRDGQRPGGWPEVTFFPEDLRALCLEDLRDLGGSQTGSSKIAQSSGLSSSQGVEVESDETSSQSVEGESNLKLEPKELTILDCPNELVDMIASYLSVEEGLSLVRAIPIFAGSLKFCRGTWAIEKPFCNTAPYTRSELIQMMAKELMDTQQDGVVTSTFRLFGSGSDASVTVYQTIKVDVLNRCAQRSEDGPVFKDRTSVEKVSQGGGLSSSATSISEQSSLDAQSSDQIPDALRLSLEWRFEDDQGQKPFFTLNHVMIEPAGALKTDITGERFAENTMTLLGINEWCRLMSSREYDGRSWTNARPIQEPTSDFTDGPAE